MLANIVSQSQVILNLCFDLRLGTFIFALLDQVLGQIPIFIEDAL